jgi:WD40 repeat protein
MITIWEICAELFEISITWNSRSKLNQVLDALTQIEKNTTVKSLKRSILCLLKLLLTCESDNRSALSERCFELSNDAFALSSSFEDQLLSTKIQIISILLQHNYFDNLFCSVYEIGALCVASINNLIATLNVSIAIADEFQPLLLPRRGNSFSRIPILRQVCVLNSFIGELLGQKASITTSISPTLNEHTPVDSDTTSHVCQPYSISQLAILNHNNSTINSVAICSLMGILITGSSNGTFSMWDMYDKTQVYKLICTVTPHPNDNNTHYNSVLNSNSINCILSHHNLVFVGHENCKIYVYDVSNVRTMSNSVMANLLPCQVLNSHTGYISCLCLMTSKSDTFALDKNTTAAFDGNSFYYLLSGSMDATVRLWDINVDTENCAVLPEAGNQIMPNTNESIIQNIIELGVCVSEKAPVRTIATDNSHIFTTFGCSSMEKSIHVYNIKLQHSVCQLHGHDSYIIALLIDFNVRALYSSAADKSIKIWNLDTLLCVGTIRTDNDINCLSLYRNNLYGGTWSRVVQVWDIISKESKTENTPIVCGRKSDDDEVISMLVSRGRLFIGTSNGRIYEKLSDYE